MDNKGAECGDLQFKFTYYDHRAAYMQHYQRILPEFADINVRLTQAKANQDVLFCLACVIMQTLGKQVNEDNVTGWFKNRLRAVAARIGHVNTETWDVYRPSTLTLHLANRSMAQLLSFVEWFWTECSTIKSRKLNWVRCSAWC